MARLLFIDTETGGLDPEKHSLLSIGVVVWDSQRGCIFSREYRLKNDEYHATKEAMKINKISSSDDINRLSGSTIIQHFKSIKDEFFTESKEIPLAGHNTAFDIRFLRQMFKINHRSYENMFSHRVVDTYSILKYLQDAGVLHDCITSSAQAFKYFGITVNGRHTALGDAYATMQLYEELLKLMNHSV